jgi:hypothetical protein
MTKLSDATRNRLKTISTATVATAVFKRGFRTQCEGEGTVACLSTSPRLRGEVGA